MKNQQKHQEQVITFFRSLKGDNIVFKNDYCGNFTDHYSEINEVNFSDLWVKVNPNYINPECVDADNMTNVSIDSIRGIETLKEYITESELDGKIIALEAFIKNNTSIITPSFKVQLENLLSQFKGLFSRVTMDNTFNNNPVDSKITRERFDNLFLVL